MNYYSHRNLFLYCIAKLNFLLFFKRSLEAFKLFHLGSNSSLANFPANINLKFSPPAKLRSEI